MPGKLSTILLRPCPRRVPNCPKNFALYDPAGTGPRKKKMLELIRQAGGQLAPHRKRRGISPNPMATIFPSRAGRRPDLGRNDCAATRRQVPIQSAPRRINFGNFVIARDRISGASVADGLATDNPQMPRSGGRHMSGIDIKRR
jgi:hypothetical protein